MNQNIECTNCVYFKLVFVQYLCISHLIYMIQKVLKLEVQAERMRVLTYVIEKKSKVIPHNGHLLDINSFD